MAPPVVPRGGILPKSPFMYSHPGNVIQFHIALWLLVTIGACLLLFLYYFYTSFGRDDPILYAQMNVNTQQKNK